MGCCEHCLLMEGCIVGLLGQLRTAEKQPADPLICPHFTLPLAGAFERWWRAHRSS